jgi:hypothetical protein
MTDTDVKCYADRYPTDVNSTVDPRQHFANIGQAQGRLSTCSKTLTSFESQRYLDKNPSLQRKFGRGTPGGPALVQANQHFMGIGYKDPSFISGRDEYTEPWFCGATEYTNCQCKGTMYMGPLKRPDNNATIKNFDEMRYWKTVVKDNTNDWTMCSSVGMGGDPFPGAAKQCWCEPAPQYEPTPCANDGEACLCNGLVAFGVKNSPDDPSKIASFYDMTAVAFAINDANNTQSVHCSSSSFEMADPLPSGSKQCFCDEKRKYLGSDVKYVKDYWRSVMTQVSSQVVLETASIIESKTETQISLVESTTVTK